MDGHVSRIVRVCDTNAKKVTDPNMAIVAVMPMATEMAAVNMRLEVGAVRYVLSFGTIVVPY